MNSTEIRVMPIVHEDSAREKYLEALNRYGIHVMELSDNHLVNGQIRHVVRWGESMRIPGIGVEFRGLFASRLSKYF